MRKSYSAIGHYHIGNVTVNLLGQLLTHHGSSALLSHLRNELMSIDSHATHGNEHASCLYLARIAGHMCDILVYIAHGAQHLY